MLARARVARRIAKRIEDKSTVDAFAHREPDNAARYWFSSVESGRLAFERSARFFGHVLGAHGESGEPSVGPKLPSILPAHGIELLSVTLFPVSVARTGAPPPPVWEGRRDALRRALERSTGDPAAADLGRAYSEALERYAHDAASAGPGFVEIQNTMLFATVGQKNLP